MPKALHAKRCSARALLAAAVFAAALASSPDGAALDVGNGVVEAALTGVGAPLGGAVGRVLTETASEEPEGVVNSTNTTDDEFGKLNFTKICPEENYPTHLYPECLPMLTKACMGSNYTMAVSAAALLRRRHCSVGH